MSFDMGFRNMLDNSTVLIIAVVGIVSCQSMSGAEGGGMERFSDLFEFQYSNWVDGDACFSVHYSDAHLVDHPDQQVTDLSILFRSDPDATVESVVVGARFRKTPNYPAVTLTKSSSDLLTKKSALALMMCSPGWSMNGIQICSTATNSLAGIGGFGIIDVSSGKDVITIETSVIGAALDERSWIGNENNCLESGRSCRPVRYKLYRTNLSNCSRL